MKITVIILGVVVVILLGLLIFIPSAKGPTAATGLAMSPDGHVAISLPHAGDLVTSPAAIEGTVVGGGWFFEGSFPVTVIDADGAVLGQASAQALGDWTSTGTVPFAASIPFTTPRSATGTLFFAKYNASGNPKNVGSFSMEVRFR
jgi:Immunoglobulin-like domain of bacterial spore germination